MAKNKLVSINIITFNAQDLIKKCLEAILAQAYSNIEILIIDNASTDKTIEVIRKTGIDYNFNFHTISNKENLGFAVGQNMGIKNSKGDYVLVLGQDVLIDKNFIRNTVETIEVNEKIGSVQGKLYKITKNMWEAKPPTYSPLTEDLASLLIDTTGLLMFKNRRIVNRGQGERDENQYSRGEIFGVDGAAALYRRKALEDTKLPVLRGATPKSDEFEYFDEDFFMYKEDVDLAWRLKLYNWKAIFEPNAIGYHLRGAGEKAVTSYLKVARERKKIKSFAKYYSFKNQRLMQIKNELCSLFLANFCRIIVKEIGAWSYVLFFEKYTWKVIKNLFKQLPSSCRKRKIIMSRKKVGSKDMKKWFN